MQLTCPSCDERYNATQDTDPCPHCLLTPAQAKANVLMSGPQVHTLLVGGARSGKTFVIVRRILLRAAGAPGSRHLIARLRFNHVRASIWLDTLPKVAKTCFPGLELEDHRGDSYVALPQYGSEIWFGGLDEKERTEKILGLEYATIFLNEVSQIAYSTVSTVRPRLAQKIKTSSGAWLPQRMLYDLNPVSRRHWSNLEIIETRSPLTGRRVIEPQRFRYMYINPSDNVAYLSEETLKEFDLLPDRQRRRFFLGEYSSDTDGALWTFESLEHARCLPQDVPDTLKEAVVAVDPSGTKGDEEERSDEVGIIVAGLGFDDKAYVLADLSTQEPPEKWAKTAVDAYRKYRCDRIIGEVNYGGDMVRAVIHAVDRNVPFREVRATRGKAVRAEPVSAFYGHERDGEWINDRVRHAGNFIMLEAQLMDMTAAGYMGAKSPDRADALVWALSDLMVDEPPGLLFTIPVVSMWGKGKGAAV